jgi:Protein of unknown function (DUF1360)
VPGYADEHRPLAGYALLTGAYNAALAATLAGARERLPERLGVRDLALLGAATYKASRLISKDEVTSFARAPFTRYEGSGKPGEVEERARGRGLRLAVGELLVCPFCVGQWVALGFVAGLLYAPRPTRAVASVFTVRAAADFLQVAYKAASDAAGE